MSGASETATGGNDGATGAAFALVLTVTLALGGLKLTGHADVSWWWVLAPTLLWLGVGLALDMAAVVAGRMLIRSVRRYEERRNEAVRGTAESVARLRDNELDHLIAVTALEAARRTGMYEATAASLTEMGYEVQGETKAGDR